MYWNETPLPAGPFKSNPQQGRGVAGGEFVDLQGRPLLATGDVAGGPGKGKKATAAAKKLAKMADFLKASDSALAWRCDAIQGDVRVVVDGYTWWGRALTAVCK